MGRIDYFLQESLEETQAAKEFIVKELTEKYPKTIDRRQNKILAAIGFAVTLLVSIKDFSQMALFKIGYLSLLSPVCHLASQYSLSSLNYVDEAPKI